MYIIRRKYISNLYYAGSNINPENVWTTNPALATWFKDRTIAVSMQEKVAERVRENGVYSIVEVQVQQQFYVGA